MAPKALTAKQKKMAGIGLAVALVVKFLFDMGVPFLIMNLYYVRPMSYLLSMGAAADGKKVVHIKYCVP